MWVLFYVAAVSSYCKMMPWSQGGDAVTPACSWKGHKHAIPPHQLLTSRAPRRCFSNRIN